MALMPYPTTEAVKGAEKAHQEAIAARWTAESTLRALQSTIQAGGDVEPSELTEAKARIEHAALRVEAKHRQVAQARYTARRQALEAIAEEVHAYDSDGGLQELVRDLTAIQGAVNAFIEHGRAYDARVFDWVKRAGALLAERHPHGFIPGPDQGHVAVHPLPGSTGSIQAKSRVLRRLEVSHVLEGLRNQLYLSPQNPDRVDLTEWTLGVVGFLSAVHPSTQIAHERVQPGHFRDS